uniref:Uncharacterized protein n=1 Tax=Stegastes partitus TaxID=144197 RepID=A0A3B4Z2A7_9TELE
SLAAGSDSSFAVGSDSSLASSCGSGSSLTWIWGPGLAAGSDSSLASGCGSGTGLAWIWGSGLEWVWGLGLGLVMGQGMTRTWGSAKVLCLASGIGLGPECGRRLCHRSCGGSAFIPGPCFWLGGCLVLGLAGCWSLLP